MPPLNLYARVRFLMHKCAHETAGAARTRSSLRPLFEGDKAHANLGRIGPRECDIMSVRHCEELSDEAIQSRARDSGLRRGACHRARVRATGGSQ
jgi:hypothetical protein